MLRVDRDGPLVERGGRLGRGAVQSVGVGARVVGVGARAGGLLVVRRPDAGDILLGMQPDPPPGWYKDPSSRYRLRWWDGHAWTGRTGLDPKWSITLLWAGLAIPAWLGAALLSVFTAEGISETPQVDQATWVALVSGLAVVPIVGAAFGWIVAFVVTRRLRPAVTVAGVTLLCMSVLLAFLVVPKAP